MRIPWGIQGPARDKTYLRLLGLLFSFQFVLFAFYGFSRHYNYLSGINDLGHFDQAIWGFLNGFPFLNTDIFNGEISRLGIHFDPIIALFVPLYFFLPHVGWLVLAQAFSLAISSVLIFLLANKLFLSRKIALVWAAVFSLNPFLLNAAAWDFHPVVLAVPVIVLSYLALENRNFRLLFLCCLVVLSCKEHFGLMVVFFGVLWGIKYREWPQSACLTAFGAVVLGLVFYWIMPAFSPSGKHIMLSSGQGQLSRYAWLGESVFDIAAAFFQNPGAIFSITFFQLSGWKYILVLFLPFLFIPLIGMGYLLPGAADLAANLLSANPLPRSVFSYHSVTLVPVFCVAAMYGVRTLASFLDRWSAMEISSFILSTTLIFAWALFPFFALPGSKNIWNPRTLWFMDDPVRNRIERLVADDSSISAQGNIGAHFSRRSRIFAFPNQVGRVDFVVLRLESPTTQPSLAKPKQVGSLAHHLLMRPADFLDSVQALLSDETYGIVVWKEPWLLLEKGKQDLASRNDVKNALDRLYSKWTLPAGDI